MTRSKFVRAIATLGIAVGVLGGAPTATAADCTLETVAGAYGSNFDGFVSAIRANGKVDIFLNKRERGLARIDLNADGTAQIAIRGFMAGVPQGESDGPQAALFLGTWGVNGDCTGDIDLDEFGAPVDWIFIAVEDASELFIVSGASLGQAHAKRISSQ